MNAERHDLIYLEPQAHFLIQSVHEDRALIEHQIRLWLEQGLPCIYARQMPADDLITLGLPLFFSDKKHRVSLTVESGAVAQHQSLPTLAEMQVFFVRYHAFKELGSMLNGLEEKVSVYGSFLFHYLSGHAFVSASSDLDVLIDYQGYSLKKIQELIVLLNQITKRSIDGEVRFKQFGDIPVNELLDLSAKKLLCKRKDNVELISRTELYEHYPML